MTRVPANITHIFQPLDLTLNGYLKQIMNRKFVDWYVSQTMEVFDKGHDLKTIDIKFRSLVMKHLHAKWLIEAYNPMTSAAERKGCVKGWERTGIQDAVERGSEANLDPFDDINTIGEVDEGSDNDCETPIKSTDKKYISHDVYDKDDQDDSE